jgi:hypothetical protein
VLLAAVIFGIMIAFTVITSIIFGTFLAMSPLLWIPLKIGLLKIATLVVLAVSMPTGSILADVFYRRSARRNDCTGV